MPKVLRSGKIDTLSMRFIYNLFWPLNAVFTAKNRHIYHLNADIRRLKALYFWSSPYSLRHGNATLPAHLHQTEITND
ncbi:hypothetical protein B9T34_17980 [Acinetobacter sp. ANC 3813]|nr:hypothetical protein B9T34_17980 [Acinetobacter sp. ANC 3813]